MVWMTSAPPPVLAPEAMVQVWLSFRAKGLNSIFISRQNTPNPVKLQACSASSALGLFEMAAKTKAHGREHLVLKVRVAARTESLVKRRGQDRHRHAFVNRRLDGPAALAGIGD